VSEPLSSDAHAWLYPFYAALKRDQGFDRLAPVLQAKALADAVQADYPAKAQEIRDWDYGTAIAMLTWLDTVTRTRPRHRETELWRVQKANRELRCVAVHLPHGIDLRLLEGADFQRTQLLPDKWRAQRLSTEWAQQLRATGWVPVPDSDASAQPRE
jgi:hypothetical protein